MGLQTIWYNRFLTNLIVPPPNSHFTDPDQETIFYALRFLSFRFKELAQGNYAVQFFFYDRIERKFFGRQWKRHLNHVSEQIYEVEDEAIFFHTSITKDRVYVICELIKLERSPRVIAWTTIPLILQGQTITDYGSQYSRNIQPNRYGFYCGSCKSLLYINELDELDKKLTKFDGIVMALLQTNSNMNLIVSFVPEYYIISFSEAIPGVVFENGMVGLADTVTAVLDNLIFSYGFDSRSIEASMLEMLTMDFCQKWNQPFSSSQTPKFNIIERRLKIGVHNGLCYIEEPHFLKLFARDDIESDYGIFRKRSRSLSQASGGHIIKNEFNDFITRNCVKLGRLCANPMLAIIFSVDYLVGFGRRDNTICESQWVTIAWNAWCPCHNGAFTIADTMTVPLVGGPRPTPDDTLCFKNLLKPNNSFDKTFASNRVQYTLKFNFAVIDSTNNALFLLSSEQDRKSTPTPKPDFPSIMSFEPDEEPFVINQKSIHTPTIIESVLSERQEKMPIEEKLSAIYPTNALKKTASVPILNTCAHINNDDDSHFRANYVNNNDEKRISLFPRNISVYFAQFEFPSIIDDGVIASFVDANEKRQVVIETELKSFLTTNEITLQFMGILNLQNQYYMTNNPSTSYFFTFQFYRFPQVTTEKLCAYCTSEWSPNRPLILRRFNDENQLVEENGNGFMVKFTISNESIPPNDADDFIKYLMFNKLYIDVWNANSLIHVGTCAIPLRFLCRQNVDAVLSNIQCSIVEEGLTENPIVTGLLYLRMSNKGHPSERRAYKTTNNKRFARICHQNNSERFCLRARPLNGIHESALQRFLSIQKLDLYQRKEELFSSDNWQRIQKWNEIKKNTQPILDASIKRFVFEEELEAYKLLRNKTKASTLLKAVFKGITTRYTITTKYGQIEFFELLLQNTFANEVFCTVDIDDPSLSLVLNVDEWKYYKDHFKLRTPIEQNLFAVDKDSENVTILLHALESVCIPLKFDPLKKLGTKSHYDQCTEFINNSEVRAIFKRKDTGEPISILEVNVEDRNFLVHRTFCWFHEECRKVSKVLAITGITGNKRILSIRSSDPTVLYSLRSCSNGTQEVLVSFHTDRSPNVKQFLLLFYADKFYSNQVAIWSFQIHSVIRMNVETIQAQIAKIPLIIRPLNSNLNDHLLQLHGSSDSITFMPPQAFVVSPEILANTQAIFVPNFAGKQVLVVTAVDMNNNRLIQRWNIIAKICEPNIVKEFDVKITIVDDQIVTKKIQLENAYEIPQTFRVHTSNEKLVRVEKEYYDISANSSIPIQLFFYPIASKLLTAQSINVQVLVFIENGETNQQEEAYLLKILYTK